MATLRPLARRLLSPVLPSDCNGCGTVLTDSEDLYCLRCLMHLPRSFYELTPRENQMADRFAGRIPFEKAVALFLYSHNSLIADILEDFKYRRLYRTAIRMGELMGEKLSGTAFFDDIDCICPVPIHWERRMKRGYNQTEELAAGLSEISCIPVGCAPKAVRGHRSQTRQTLENRINNPKGRYKADKYAYELAGKHVLLLDDVCTTGSTLIAAADALLDAVPTARISILTLAATV